MIVMKFGGASLSGVSEITQAVELISGYREQGPVAIVVSAIGTMTEYLFNGLRKGEEGSTLLAACFQFHEELCKGLKVDSVILDPLRAEIKELSQNRETMPAISYQERVVAFGEQFSARVVAAALSKKTPASAFDSWDAGIELRDDKGYREIREAGYVRIRKTLKEKTQDFRIIPVITGYIGKQRNGMITNLGRGGSDLTATALGAALEAREIIAWKDVTGIMSADPCVVSSADVIPEISYEEAGEMAFFGAQVLHPRSMDPARAHGVPVRIKSFLKPEHPGTLIRGEIGGAGFLKAVTGRKDIVLIDIVSNRMLGQYGFLSRIFSVFEALQLSVDLIATSEVSVSCTLDENHDAELLKASLEKYAQVSIHPDRGILTLIGGGQAAPLLLAEALKNLHDEGIQVEMVSHGASKTSTGIVLKSKDLNKALNMIHGALLEEVTI
ncbi:MAG TPA: aspartate kinase [Candidatus Mcinerneyibacteriales bacterium]|nr:aspartate kinase [Candidatus Mcinerneyibacteriales bacterium]